MEVFGIVPYYLVRMAMKAPPRRMMVRTMVAPQRTLAELPLGRLAQEHEERGRRMRADLEAVVIPIRQDEPRWHVLRCISIASYDATLSRCSIFLRQTAWRRDSSGSSHVVHEASVTRAVASTRAGIVLESGF